MADLPAGAILLRLDGLCFTKGGSNLVNRITLTLAAGPRTVILGANGAGKSVLLRLMHGLLVPTSGRVEWCDEGRRELRQAMVFQRPILLRRSAIANIRYALKLSGLAATQRTARALESLRQAGLARLADRPARVLSGGEQQRLVLARAWSLQPDVMFLDEPTASLDPSATREVEAVIQNIHANGTKIVMTTHNLGQARRIADEIVFMHQGKVTEQTPASEFFEQPRSAEAKAFMQGELP